LLLPFSCIDFVILLYYFQVIFALFQYSGIAVVEEAIILAAGRIVIVCFLEIFANVILS
jgi:hypothetical protein